MLFAAAFALVATALASCGGEDNGPIQPPSGTRSMVGALRPVGAPMSMTVVSLGHWPGGGSPIVLDSVEPTSHPSGLRILGYRVAENEGQGGVGALDGFPPEGFTTAPLHGFSFSKGTGPIQVIVGLELTKPGNFWIEAFVLRYQAGDRRYEATFLEGVQMCTRPPAVDDCPAAVI